MYYKLQEAIILEFVLLLLVNVETQANAAAPPAFVETPTWPDQSYYDENGPAVVLNCKVTNVTHTLVWYKDEQLLDSSDELLVLENQNQSLRFEVPKVYQSGLYLCLAYNTAGNVSHSGTIFITARTQETRPRIVQTTPASSVVHLHVGETANLSCTFDVGGSLEALMDLAVDWYKDGQLLEDDDHTTYGLENTENNNKISILTVSNLKEDDYGVYQCYGENSQGNVSKLVSVLPPELPHKDFPLDLAIACSAGGFVAIVTIVTVIILRRRYLARLKYEELEWLNPDTAHYDVPNRKLEYDVFISYSSEDLMWVKDMLFTKLCEHGYEVCIDFKDFTPGNDVADNIMDAVYKSRKTIVLLSKNFLKSMWGQFELQQAHNRAIMQRSDVLVIIKYDNSKVPTKLMGKTFLDWSDSKVKPHFWTRLDEAIGEPGSFLQPDDKTDIPELFFEQDTWNPDPGQPNILVGETRVPENCEVPDTSVNIHDSKNGVLKNAGVTNSNARIPENSGVPETKTRDPGNSAVLDSQRSVSESSQNLANERQPLISESSMVEQSCDLIYNSDDVFDKCKKIDTKKNGLVNGSRTIIEKKKYKRSDTEPLAETFDIAFSDVNEPIVCV